MRKLGWFTKRERGRDQGAVHDADDAFAPGDIVLQQYRVLASLGEGGFGTVRLVEDVRTGGLFAMKLLRAVEQPHLRDAFHREAAFWVGLEPHPCVLAARMVDEANGRLLILSEYIAQDSRGVNSLADYAARPQSLEKTINLLVQVCDGLTWAYEHGLVAHRDIKPSNILISEGSLAKIADFGIALARDADLSFWDAFGPVGTAPYSAPEQLASPTECDVRSDIYSFGITMKDVSGHDDAKGQALLSRVIARCVATERKDRYQSFAEVRRALEVVAGALGLKVWTPVPTVEGLEFWEWHNRGASYLNLGRSSRALECFDKALEQFPDHALAWRGKGDALAAMDRNEEALACYQEALKREPDSVESLASHATALRQVGKTGQARKALSRALQLAPDDAMLWTNMGNLEATCGNAEKALECYDQATDFDESFDNAWFCKGTYLDDLGRYADALACLDEAVRLNPVHSNAWDNRGVTLMKMGKKKEALASFDRAILTNPGNTVAHVNKAMLLTALLPPRRGNFEKAAEEAVIALKQDDSSAAAWYAYGRANDGIGRNEEAIKGYRCFLALSEPESMGAELGWVRERLSRIG